MPTQSQGRNVNLDGMAKPFPSTTAYHHTQHSLNYMQALLEADKSLGVLLFLKLEKSFHILRCPLSKNYQL